MGKFIVFTFAMLFWAFYEMSGGSEFEPEVRQVAEADVQAPTPAVTRAATQPTLISLSLPAREEVETPAVAAEPITPVIEEVALETEAPDTTAAEEVAAVVQEAIAPPKDMRFVDARRVNMRQGPGTNFNVINAYDRGTEAEVLLVDASGWAQIRIIETGETGWMAERLLTDG